MDEIRLHLLDSEADNFLEVVKILLIGKAGAITERLLISVTQKNGFAQGIALNPLLRTRFFDEEGLVHHGVPLYVCVHLHAVAMSDGSSVNRVLHLGHLGGHAEALVKMGMKNLDSLAAEQTNDLFALCLLINLAGV